MRIFKDNYTARVIAQVRPVAIAGLSLVALVLVSGLGLALGEVSGVRDFGGALFIMLMLIAAVLSGPRMLRNEYGFLGRSGKGGMFGSDTQHLQGARKYSTKKQVIYLQQALAAGNMTPLGGAVPFPFGDGYLTMMIDFYITIVIGTGTGAISEGELLFIKNIYMKTDKHGAIVDNVCGRALYKRAQKIMCTAPYKDAMAAASATYVVSMPIHFANPRLRRKEDTILDLNGVKSLDLQITLGSLSDLLTTPGSATVSVLADISVEKTLGPVDLGNYPVMQPYLAPINPWDPSVQQNIELPKTDDLGILDLMLFTSNSASAGIPWSGTPTANVIKRFTFEDNIRKTFDQFPVTQLKNDNKLKFQYETIPTGIFILDFIEEDSIWQGFPVGGKAKVNLNWINDTLSTSQISGLIDGTLSLRNLSM